MLLSSNHQQAEHNRSFKLVELIAKSCGHLSGKDAVLNVKHTGIPPRNIHALKHFS